jgi:hypothetical protein
MRKRFHVLLPFVLIGLPLVIEALYINRFSVNVLYVDQWALVLPLQALLQRDLGQFLALLWGQHNEHRIPFPKLIFLVLSRASNWDVTVEMYFSLFLAGLSLVGLGLIYRRTCRGPLWAFVPVSWLVFSLGQWENILWGWQMVIYLQVLGVILGILCLSAKSVRAVGLASMCGTVASFSFSSGLLIWPVGFLCLAALRAGKRQLVLWSLVGTLATAAYFRDYAFPAHHPSLVQALYQPLTTAVFFLANVGAALGGNGLELSVIMGVYLVILLLILCYQKISTMIRADVRVADSDIILSGLVLFSFLSSLVIAISRVEFGFGLAITPRYTTITSVGIVGIYMFFVRHSLLNRGRLSNPDRGSSALFPALLSVLIIGLAVTNLLAIQKGKSLYTSRLGMQYILQTFDVQSDNALTVLYPSPQAVREYAEFLRDQSLSAFDEPVRLLLLTSSKDGLSAGEILPNRPIVQTFRCPVQTLNDVGILFATYARSNTSDIEITLMDNGQPVIQRTLSSAEVEDNSWVRTALPQPIEDCLGRELVLRIRSQDANPGNAITVWTYPRYYDGDLLEPKEQQLADRVIGLELNVSLYGLSK